MDFLLNEFGIEIAQEKIAHKLGMLSIKYEKTHNPEIKRKLETLLLDRDEIYKKNKDVIKKYVGDNRKWTKIK